MLGLKRVRRIRDLAEKITQQELDLMERQQPGFDPEGREESKTLRQRIRARVEQSDECKGIASFLILAILSGVVSHFVQRWLRKREERLNQ
jgi:hypothetical protein